MTQIDSSIFAAFGVKPKSVADYDAQHADQEARKVGLQANKLQLMLGQQKADEYTRGIGEQNRLRMLAQGWGADTTDDQRTASLKNAGFFAQADALEKGLLERQKTGADAAYKGAQTEKERLATARDKIGLIANVAGSAKDQASYAQGLQLLQHNGIDVSNLPQQYEPAYVANAAQQALTQQQRLEQMWKEKGYELDVRKQAETERNNKTQNNISYGSLDVSRGRLNLEKEQAGLANGAGGFSALPGFGRAPAGYMWDASGGAPALKPIKGGPADTSTEGERRAATLLRRLEFSEGQLDQALTESPEAQKPGYLAEAARKIGGDTAANAVNPQARQRVEAAQLDILDAALTLGTGAAYTKEQLDGYRRSYFPQLNDDDKTVADKKARLKNVIEAAKIAAGRAAPTGGNADDARAFASEIRKMRAAPQAAAEKPGGGFSQEAGNSVAGLVRGAGSIGATILAPYDIAKDALAGKGLGLESNRERRADMDGGLRALGADNDSWAYKGGKLAGEIAGTAGVGGVTANALSRIPGVAAAAPNVLQAITTSGMRAGNASGLSGMGARMLGGGITGGASAGLANPEDASLGAVVGGGLPPLVAGAGRVGHALVGGTKAAITGGLGMATGAGRQAVEQAFAAGKNKSQDFLDNMRGSALMDEVLDRAKQGLEAMRSTKLAEYRSGMVPITNDKSVLSFQGIDKALEDASSLVKYQGQVKNAAAADAVAKMQEAVEQWRGLDPGAYHTPEGLDALKQKLGAILEAVPFEQKTARLAAGKIYQATKASIEQQAPAYAKVMDDYSAASGQISEIERALSLGDKASKDTALRKLQSLMRNNVQTNYGNRLNLAGSLEQQGGVELMPALAGQALSQATPRGLAAIGASGNALLSLSNPALAMALPFQSPRLVGEAAYRLGRFSGAAGEGVSAAQKLAAQNNRLVELLGAAPGGAAAFGYRAAPLLPAQREQQARQ